MCQHSREVVPKYGLSPDGPEATDSHCLAPIHTHTHTHNLIRMLRELLDHIMPHLRRDLGRNRQRNKACTHLDCTTGTRFWNKTEGNTEFNVSLQT